MADWTTVNCNIYDTAGNYVVFQIRDTQDLGKLVQQWCQRNNTDPTTVVLQVQRTGRCVSLFDEGTIARNIIVEGDQLVQLEAW